jgi:hypothetical protein
MGHKKKSKKTAVDLSKLAQNVKEWVVSPDGQKNIQEVLENSKEMTSKLRKARDIDPKSLHEPFTL